MKIMPDDWTIWLIQAQDGDKTSYRLLLEQIYKIGNIFLFKKIKNPQVREEILQEAIISIHKGLSSYDRSYSARTWIYAILKNKLIDSFRKQNREVKEAADSDLLLSMIASLEENHTELMLSQWLNINLKKLSEDQKQIFELVSLEGHSITDAASTTGHSEANVKVLLHRARSFLKEEYLNGDTYGKK